MVRNTFTGLNQIDQAMCEAGIALGLTRIQRLWNIEIPLAMPTIMAGIRTMLVMTIALTGIASFIGAGGLGVAIYRGITTNQSALTIAGSLLIALLAITVDALFSLGERVTRISPHMEALYDYICFDYDYNCNGYRCLGYVLPSCEDRCYSYCNETYDGTAYFGECFKRVN